MNFLIPLQFLDRDLVELVAVLHILAMNIEAGLPTLENKTVRIYLSICLPTLFIILSTYMHIGKGSKNADLEKSTENTLVDLSASSSSKKNTARSVSATSPTSPASTSSNLEQRFEVDSRAVGALIGLHGRQVLFSLPIIPPLISFFSTPRLRRFETRLVQ